jgi:hypothetical protein
MESVGPGLSSFLKNNITPVPVWQEIVDFSYRTSRAGARRIAGTPTDLIRPNPV